MDIGVWSVRAKGRMRPRGGRAGNRIGASRVHLRFNRETFIMRPFRAILFGVTAVLTLAGCQAMTQQERSELTGTVLGAGAGLLLADAFDANPAWSVAAGLGGAAIGQQVARNTSTGECAYYAGRNASGQPVYRTGPC
jgi:hypothetical protein